MQETTQKNKEDSFWGEDKQLSSLSNIKIDCIVLLTCAEVINCKMNT